MNIKSIFLNGRMVKAETALVDSLAPGVVKGKGVFETMRACEGEIFALKDHFDRLFRGLNLLGIYSPYSKKRWGQHLHRVMRENRLKDARVRLAVWKEGRSLRTAIVCQEAGGYSEYKYQRGFQAIISDVKREKTRFSHIKSMDYSCFRRAFEEAGERGCDEAILLNNRGELVEGSRTNIFFIKKEVLCTPAVRCGCLNGITRQIVIKCARQMGIFPKVAAAKVRQLLQADEAFVTNSVMGIMPLTVVEGRLIGSGKAGSVTRKLLRAYRRNVHSSCPAQGKFV